MKDLVCESTRKMFTFLSIRLLYMSQAILLGVAPAALAVCGGAQPDTRGETLVFTGLVTDVEARSLLELESIEVTDRSGAALRFHAERGQRFAEFSPSHARGHMLLAEPVEVTYREMDGLLFIVDLADAPVERLEPS